MFRHPELLACVLKGASVIGASSLVNWISVCLGTQGCWQVCLMVHQLLVLHALSTGYVPCQENIHVKTKTTQQ